MFVHVHTGMIHSVDVELDNIDHTYRIVMGRVNFHDKIEDHCCKFSTRKKKASPKKVSPNAYPDWQK